MPVVGGPSRSYRGRPMHAIRLHAFGPAENLRYEEVDDPAPGLGQVRIAVAAAGVHLIDTAIRAGRPQGPLPLPELPTIPGREVAGVVDALGPDTDAGLLGRRVVTHLGVASGGYAELAVGGADSLHAIPDGLADDVAVAAIGTGPVPTLGSDPALIPPDLQANVQTYFFNAPPGTAVAAPACRQQGKFPFGGEVTQYPHVNPATGPTARAAGARGRVR